MHILSNRTRLPSEVNSHSECLRISSSFFTKNFFTSRITWVLSFGFSRSLVTLLFPPGESQEDFITAQFIIRYKMLAQSLLILEISSQQLVKSNETAHAVLIDPFNRERIVLRVLYHISRRI